MKREIPGVIVFILSIIIAMVLVGISGYFISRNHYMRKINNDRLGSVTIYSIDGEISYYGKIHIREDGNVELYTE